MEFILGEQPADHYSLNRDSYKHALHILPLDNRSQSSGKSGQWKIECILDNYKNCRNRQGKVDNSSRFTIIQQIYRGSHKSKYKIAISSNNGVTRYHNKQTRYQVEQDYFMQAFSNYQRIVRNELLG